MNIGGNHNLKMEIIYQGMLALISMFEMWMYYQLVYEVLIDKKRIKKLKMALFWEVFCV